MESEASPVAIDVDALDLRNHDSIKTFRMQILKKAVQEANKGTDEADLKVSSYQKLLQMVGDVQSADEQSWAEELEKLHNQVNELVELIDEVTVERDELKRKIAALKEERE